MKSSKSVVVLLCLVVSVCIGCFTTLAAEKSITLTHYKFNSRADQVAILQQLADEFHQQYPHITINIITGPEGPEYEEKVKVMLVGGQPPDITEFYTSLASSLADAGQFLDLRPYVAKDPRWQAANISVPAIQGSTWTDGTLIMMPTVLGANILAYNGDLISQAGFAFPNDMGERWNWDAMMSMVRKVTKDENADGTPEQWGNMGRVTLTRVLTYMIGAGDNPFDGVYSPKSANFLKPGVLAGARFAAELLDPALGTTNYNNFIQGKAGFCWIGIFPFSVELARMRLDSSQIDFRVSPWPLGPAGNQSTVAEIRGWQIMKDSPYKDEAYEWLAFVHLNQQRSLAYANVHGWIPPSTNLQGKWLQTLDFSGVEKEMVSTAIQTTLDPGNLPSPAGPGVLEVINAWNNGFANVYNKKMPLETFLEQMNVQAAQLLAL
jgi:multiple sugar transport system substrate-binding protein